MLLSNLGDCEESSDKGGTVGAAWDVGDRVVVSASLQISVSSGLVL